MLRTRTSFAAIALTALAILSMGPVVASAQEAATRIEASTVAATVRASKEGRILDTKIGERSVRGGIVRVGIVHRTNAESNALVHQELTEVYQIIEGSGILMTGGTVTSQRPVSDPPNLGSAPSFFVTQTNGATQPIGPGDVVIIPAGMPHRFTAVDGTITYTVYRFEPTARP